LIELDHVVIGAADLEQGTAYLQDRLGVTMPPGGKHPDMSTHNRVLRVGDGVFFELMAIDPEAPTPKRSRWFGLDAPDRQRQLSLRPQPIGWVVRTDDIEAVCARSPIDLGRILRLSRGERTWRITVPDDGEIPLAGLLPAFIEWSPGPHPSVGMPFLGLTFERVVLRHPDPPQISDLAQALGIAELVNIEHDGGRGPALHFDLRMPDGTACRFE
jgi:hypothetical protein